MVELLSTMWAYLLGAAVIGLILGWAIRGVFLPRAKSINVTTPEVAPLAAPMSDEDKAKIAFADDAKGKLASLEARTEDAVKLATTQREQLNKAANRIKELEAALAAAQKAPEPPVSKGEDEGRARLVWMNRYLESRVRHVEGLLGNAGKPAAETIDTERIAAALAETKALLERAENDVAAVVASRDEVLKQLDRAVEEGDLARAKLIELEAGQAETPEADLADASRLAWQNRYLKARLLLLEENGSNAQAAIETPAAPETSSVESEGKIDALKAEISALKEKLTTASADEIVEQEMARLRWRNRYLEGRLNYLEAATIDAANEAEAAGAVKVTEDEQDAPEALPEADEPEILVTAEDEVRPPSLDAPDRGEPDDLKRIGGVGPKIEGILNELGIFYFDQIAGWTPQEASWIDSYLRFQGRVIREKWVAQAAGLGNSEV